jgi:hypothetical protein
VKQSTFAAKPNVWPSGGLIHASVRAPDLCWSFGAGSTGGHLQQQRDALLIARLTPKQEHAALGSCQGLSGESSAVLSPGPLLLCAQIWQMELL